MPLTATFLADLDGFTKSLAGAHVHLTTFERGAKNASRSVTRELEAISGQKVAAEAARMAEAMKRLGGEGGVAAGLLKLTDDELQRVAATMEDATAKAARLGEELPDSLKHLNAELAKVPAARKGFDLLDASFAKLTTSFAAATLIDRAVTGIIGFGAGAVEAAGDLVDLNKATDVSIGTLQAWGHVARQGGIELETLTKASFDLGTKLDGGSDSVREAVERLGLSFATIRALKPEAQMDEILRASDALGPTQERNAILVDLFGSRGAQALARVVEGYRQTADEASRASDAQVQALDRAADAWDRWLTGVGTETIKILGGALEYAEDTAAAIRLLAPGALEAFSPGQQIEIERLRGAGGEGLAAYLRSIEQATRGNIELSASTSSYVAELAAANAEVAKFLVTASSADKAELAAALQLGGDRAERLADQLGLSERSLALYKEALAKAADETRRAEEASERFQQQLAQLGGGAALAGAEQALGMLQALGGPLQILPSQVEQLRRRFEAGAEAAQLLGDADLAAFYAGVARDLQPVTLLQARYNVTIGEFVTAAEDATVAILDQNAALGETETRYFGIVPAIQTATNALVPFKAAVTETPSKTPFFDIVREHLDTLEDHLASSANAFARLGQVSGRGMGQVAEAVAIAATAVSDFNDLVDELAEGDKLGAVLAGAKLGANLAASLWDGLTTSDGERAVREVGRHFGVVITEEMGNAIAADADKLFRGDRFAASIFNLDDIIGAAGGLNTQNLAEMQARLRDVFVMLETGAFTSAQAVEVLDENFQAFLEAATDGSGRLSDEMVEIIELTRRFGLESKAVTAYLREQAAAALDGANAVIGYLSNQYDQFQDLADNIRGAQEAIDRLNETPEGGRGVEWGKDMAKAQGDLTRFLADQHAAGEAVRGELELLGQIAVGVYGAAIAAGLSHSQALAQALPGLEQLVTAYENLGLSAEDAGVQALLFQAQLMRDNPGLLAGVDGLAQSFTALANMGLLNADTFAQMQAAGGAMFSRIQGELANMGADMSTNLHALIPMQDYLQAVAREAERLGLPLDANTQMLIDQSKELGLWKDAGEEGAETLQDVMGELTDAVRELGEVFRQLPRSVTTDVTTRYHQEGAGGGPTQAPTPTVSPAAAASAARVGRGGGDITTRVYLDGREVAMAVAPHRRAAERAWGAD